MKVGILSDTHGDAVRTATAAELLQQHGVEVVLHCGDIGSESVLTELAASFGPAGIPVHAVLGNVDLYDDDLQHFPSTSGVTVHGRMAELGLGTLRVAIVHGDDAQMLSDAIASQRFDVVCTGHTHVQRDERVGKTRVINPGAVYRARPPTVAVLDTERERLAVLRLPVDE